LGIDWIGQNFTEEPDDIIRELSTDSREAYTVVFRKLPALSFMSDVAQILLKSNAYYLDFSKIAGLTKSHFSYLRCLSDVVTILKLEGNEAIDDVALLKGFKLKELNLPATAVRNIDIPCRFGNVA
jgi:hypothetical protein